MLTLGSLFDGIGVFPLAASMNGITPLWASEIELAPMSITKLHFPDMLQLGDITKLNGGDIPAVDILTFGSPCQNLSQCGNRTGLAGEKSSLFYHAIRLINEMRDATDNLFPTITIWENVMGAFSSSDRMDFKAVLQSFQNSELPMPTSGKWANSGMVRGRCPDLAWRLMDARYWAIPPLARRQRIFLVADFGGQRAAEILFKPRPVQPLFVPGPESWLSSTAGDRSTFIQAGGQIPIVRPFQGFRMRGAAKHGNHQQFVGSFGYADDPFSTLLANGVSHFAFYFADTPEDGFIRILTETECERLMGLPHDWTRYGADGREIHSTNRYTALGNSIALPCADYIMSGVKEALDG